MPKVKKSIKVKDSVISKIEKDIKALRKKKKDIKSDIQEIIDLYNVKSASAKEAEKWVDRLPLETLKELQDFLSGKKKNFNLSDLKERSLLRKKHMISLEELARIENEMARHNIDLLLAKVNYLLKNNQDS